MKQAKQVAEWHRKFGVPIADIPTRLQPNRVDLRHNILQEEVNELFKATIEGDMIESADAIADILYVVLGTACELGLHDKVEEIFDEVHRSNMSKLDENGEPVKRADGKILKSKLFSQPQLEPIINA